MTTRYDEMRTFTQTPEPKMAKRAIKGPLRFVVQQHRATRMHYDFRLELDGVLKSWAVPKGPSLNPADKRLAMMTEDHPYDYKDFEGIIPPGNYGAGEVIVWDQGTYEVKDGDRKATTLAMRKGLDIGHVTFTLHGEKLQGTFSLVKMPDDKQQHAWLLIKQEDDATVKTDITARDESVVSGRTIADMQGKKTARKGRVHPMLATAVAAPFSREGWVFEVKWDGYRAIAEVQGKSVRLYSRNGISFAEKFAPIVDKLRILGHDAVLDGEVVVLDEKGISRFQLLQNYLEDGELHGQLAYYAFDILELNGKDLRQLALRDRKQLLRAVIAPLSRVRYSDHIERDGEAFFAHTQKLGLEGMIAKDALSPYREGSRSGDWLKVKTVQRQEAVICGFTAPRGGRKYFGALVLGVFEGNDLRYIGHTGGGFTDAELKSLYGRLQPLVRDAAPFYEIPKTNAPVSWVEPRLVCEVEFQEWTKDGSMRKPIFIGLREDKAPEDVTREVAIGETLVQLSNLEKVYWPHEGYTKGDAVRYYESIADVMLPYLADRPESLHRHPNGIAGQSFYHKNFETEVPGFVQTCTLTSSEEGKKIRYLMCNNRETLAFMANLGCIEINPWNSRRGHLDNPDWMVIDLDPEGVPFADVIKTAQVTHKLLDELGVESYCKTSGKTGLHIYVPMGAKYSYAQVRQFCELLVRIAHQRLPEITTLERSLSKRPHGVYLDYLQNKRGQTLAAPYSLRPVPHATVSTPLKWSEVRKGLDPTKFTIKTVHRRLEKFGDLWKGVLGAGIDMENALQRLGMKIGTS